MCPRDFTTSGLTTGQEEVNNKLIAAGPLEQPQLFAEQTAVQIYLHLELFPMSRQTLHCGHPMGGNLMYVYCATLRC